MASNVKDKSSQVLAAVVAMLFLTTVAVILRLVARKISNVKLWQRFQLT